MNKEIKKNCTTCKFGFLDKCETLQQNEEYQKLKDEMLKNFEFKETFICDNYESMYIEYPIEISKINTNNNEGNYRNKQIGKFVKISPCESEGKTYLGLYLGEMPVGHRVSYNPKTKELDISFSNNPAIFVFDLNKIVYGMESWWGIIENEEDMREITNKDIDNVWYMKALKEMEAKGELIDLL